MSIVREDCRYSKDHEWIRMEDELTGVCGITDHAQEMLTDIVFVELPETGIEVKKGSQVAIVESVKAVSDVYAPVDGVITAVNSGLEDAPEKINADPYEEGWLFKIELKSALAFEELMGPEEYVEYVESQG